MEFQQVIGRRRMVRNFEDRPVERAALERILSNATRAPSAGFSQGWAFLVLTEAAERERFWAQAWPEDERHGGDRLGVMRAPAIVVPLADKGAYLDRYAEPDKGWTDRDESRWPVPFWLVDASFAAMLALLTVVDEGLAALFFGLTRERATLSAFGVPDALSAIGAIAIGYPAPDVPSPSLARGRRPLSDVAHWGRW